MPTLHWLGKDKVTNHHLDIPYHTLDLQYHFGNNQDNPTNQVNQDSDNLIIHADNLLALKSLLPQYEGRVKCIYIDPPYNTGNEGWVYNDNVSSPRFKKWLGQVVGKEGEDLTRHDKWLCMMYPRLKLLHKLLAEDGAIFISIDDNEQASLKMMMDEIWGRGNFVANIIWQKRKGGGNDSFYMATDHEYVFCYIKNEVNQNEKWRVEYEGDYIKRYKLEDSKGKFYYDTLSRPGLNNPIIYDVICPDGQIIKDGTWQISKKSFDLELESGEVDFIKNKNGGYTVVRKVRMPEGKVFRSIINDVTNKDAADEMLDILGNKKRFSTPKPSAFIEKILKLSTDKNSIILDSFAGSGTTAHAVLNLNKQDGGNRQFILIEMEDYAETITAERVKRVINGYGTTEGTGGSFSFYTLGERVLDDEQNLNPNLALHKIHGYIWYSETHTAFTQQATAAGYLGKYHNTGIYFHYQPHQVTVLDDAYLTNVTELCEQYIMYADVCLLPETLMHKHNIIFKKIPRDISKL